jgi:hypothetical protein
MFVAVMMDKLKYTENAVGMGVKLGVSLKGTDFDTDVNAGENI